MRLIYTGLMFMLLLSQAHAKANVALTIPNAQTCSIPAARPGEQSIQALQRIGPTPFAAEASWGYGYPPTITYSLVFFQLEPKVQLFLSLHECGHLALRTTNEFRANCYALAHAAWTKADLDLIGERHEAVGPLPPQYGGSGHSFWAGTKEACPQYFK